MRAVSSGPAELTNTAQAYCKQQNANYKPVIETDGSFNGNCVMDAGSSASPPPFPRLLE